MYNFLSSIVSFISIEKLCINLPPAPTHSDQELNSVGKVIVLLQYPVIAEHIEKASINFTIDLVDCMISVVFFLPYFYFSYELEAFF